MANGPTHNLSQLFIPQVDLPSSLQLAAAADSLSDPPGRQGLRRLQRVGHFSGAELPALRGPWLFSILLSEVGGFGG